MEKINNTYPKMNLLASELLEERRKNLNLTCTDVGEYIGISNSYYSKIEKGKSKSLKADKIFKLKEILKLNEREFKQLLLFLFSPQDERIEKIFVEVMEEIKSPKI